MIGNTLSRNEKGRFPIKFISALTFYSWNIHLCSDKQGLFEYILTFRGLAFGQDYSAQTFNSRLIPALRQSLCAFGIFVISQFQVLYALLATLFQIQSSLMLAFAFLRASIGCRLGIEYLCNVLYI